MPDLYMRMSASTKAVLLGIGFLLAGIALDFGDQTVTTKAFLILIFFFLKSPVAAHVIARAAYYSGVPLWEETRIDQLREAGIGPEDASQEEETDATPPRPTRAR